MSANDSPERDPSNWALLGSNDGGTNWTTLDVQANQVFTGRYQTRSYSTASPSGHNTARLRIDRAAPLAVQFAGQASGGRDSLPPIDTTDDRLGAVTAAGENNGINGFWEVATNAFDNTTGTKWLDFADSYPNTRQSWIQYRYANN